MNAASIATMRSRPTAEIDRQLILFPRGLLGFEDARQFVFECDSLWEPLRKLAAVDDPYLNFVVAPPRAFMPGYAITIEPETIRDLGATDSSELDLWAILTDSEDPSQISLNLQGPILINHLTGRGMQIVLTSTRYSTCHPVFDAGSPCTKL